MNASYVHHAETRPLEPDDLEPILQHLAQEYERGAVRWRVTEGQGPNTAFVIDGHVVAAGGFQLCHAGMADPWLVVAPRGASHFRPLYRAIVAWLAAQINAYGLHRLQAGVRADDRKAIVLLQHLGFHYEATMEQFGPDRSHYYLYAWVRRDS
jgi:hypothetical protein